MPFASFLLLLISFSLAPEHLHKTPFLSEMCEATSLAAINQHDFNEISVLKLTDTS